MKAEVISIGTELLLGDIHDTNATKIAKGLKEIGLDLIYRTTVGDNEERIATCIEIALRRVDVVITSGGLGPTVDDVTREAIARATGRPLEFQEVLYDQIVERFKRFGAKMTENNRRQAFAPTGAVLIENPVGTAPVFILETEQGVILCLPGVPREMEYLLEEEMIPWLQSHMGVSSIIESLTLRTAGIGESQIDNLIADMMTWTNPTIGLAAHPGQTDIRITAKAASRQEVLALIEPAAKEIRRRVGRWIFGINSETLEEAVAEKIRELGLTVAIYEAGMQGLLAKRLKAALDEDAKNILQSVNEDFPGNTSRSAQEVAEAQATAIRNEAGSDIAIAAVLHKNENDGSMHIGLAAEQASKTISRAYSWGSERTDGDLWVTTHALALFLQLLSPD